MCAMGPDCHLPAPVCLSPALIFHEPLPPDLHLPDQEPVPSELSSRPNMSLAQNEDFLKAAFRGYDKNGDGRVTREEFKRVMLRTRCTSQS